MTENGSSGWTFEWLTKWDEVWDGAFVKLWQDLLDQSPQGHVFYHPSVVRAWWESSSGSGVRTPMFVVARRGEDNVALFPLGLYRFGWKQGFQRLIAPVGGDDFDYYDPILSWNVAADSAMDLWPCLSAELSRRWRGWYDVLAMRRLKYPEYLGVQGGIPVDHAPAIDLDGFGSLEDFLKGGKMRNLRNEVHNLRHRAEKLGALSFRVFEPGEVDDAIKSLSGFAVAHARRWGYAEGQGRLSFYEQLVHHCLLSGIFLLSEVRLKEVPISWQLSLVYHRTCCDYVKAFASEMHNVSPGTLHLSFMVDWAIHQGMAVLDLGRGIEPYKLRWANRISDIYSINEPATGLRAALCILWEQRVHPSLGKVGRGLNRCLGRRGLGRDV